MKLFVSFFLAITLTISTAAMAVTIDGVVDADYGSAIVTQQIGTVAGDNNFGNQGIANGSELDAAYGFVSNGVLYLVMAGNFNSLPTADGGTAPNDYLNLFFMTGPGGDNTLGTNYSATFNGRINNMGVGANGTDPGAPGMTFDADFAANYWIGVNVGLDESQNPGNTMFVDFQVVCANCPSAYLGSVPSTNLPPNNVLLVSGQGIAGLNGTLVSLNNTNVNGVDATPCYTNASGAAQSLAAAAVPTGVELAIPLAALGNPTGAVRICSFITDKFFQTIYNQVLGPVWDGTTTYCQGFLAGGSPAYVNFGSLPGQHYFTVPVPPCDVILVNPTSASYATTGGVGNVTVANFGGCPITVTTNSPWLSVISSSGLGSGNGSFTYRVGTNTSVFSRTGQFFITNTEGSGNIVTQTVTISQAGTGEPPLGVVVVDGSAEATYGCPIVVQQLPTQFGNSTSGNISNALGGSELDAAYGVIQNDVLFLVFAGNLEGNGNKLDVFLQTGDGGMNTLTNLYTPNQSNINSMKGLTFGPGFAPNHVFIINDFGGTLFADYVQLWPGGTNATGNATNAYYLGSSTPPNGTLQGGNNPFGIQIGVNNSNTNGVNGFGTCNTNTYVVGFGPQDVRTGVELAIPLSVIGNPTGAIAVCAFVNSGDQTFLSNQFLPPLGTNDTNVLVCQGNLGSPANVTLTNQSAAFFLVGPEVRVTGISKSSNDINVSWRTAISTNWSYQLQRSSTLNTAVWANVGSPTNATGNTVIQADPSAATNNPALFYRVRQTPNCP